MTSFGQLLIESLLPPCWLRVEGEDLRSHLRATMTSCTVDMRRGLHREGERPDLRRCLIAGPSQHVTPCGAANIAVFAICRSHEERGDSVESYRGSVGPNRTSLSLACVFPVKFIVGADADNRALAIGGVDAAIGVVT